MVYSDEASNKSDSDSKNEDEYLLSITSLIYQKPITNINAGLINCKSTCYINSAIQFMFQLPFIENAFKTSQKQCSKLADSLAHVYFSS